MLPQVLLTVTYSYHTDLEGEAISISRSLQFTWRQELFNLGAMRVASEAVRSLPARDEIETAWKYIRRSQSSAWHSRMSRSPDTRILCLRLFVVFLSPSK
jgi:hypothetical protein